MRKIMSVFLVLAAATIILAANAAAMNGCDSNCISCHKLDKHEAAEIIRELNPGLTVESVQISPSRGLWEIAVKSKAEPKGEKAIWYLDFSKGNIIIGKLIGLKTKENLTEKRNIELNKVDYSSIPIKDALLLGEKSAKHKVIIFTDPDCPYCKRLHDELKKIVAKRTDTAFYILLYPITKLHPEALKKSKSVMCAKSLQLLDDAFDKKPLPEPTCNAKSVDDNIKIAEGLGLSGTPALVFPDGVLIRGAMPAEEILRLLDK
ncbi:DsbC family protein [Candidatus Magnetominusculus xianensis]|nr:DsbC family protein [Candidatus Magnetominusculus xianensis]MBF0404506.1 DsbC family protein [Nitrospirota bacterium]